MKKQNGKKNVYQYWIQTLCRYLNPLKGYTNPLRHSCPAMFVFNAIDELGLDKWHHVNDICTLTKKLMSSVYYCDELTVWDAFSTSPVSGEDADNRLKSIVLHLHQQYDSRLRSMGCCIEKSGKNDKTYLRLNTNPSKNCVSASVPPTVKQSFFQRLLSVVHVIAGIFHG